jgi:hypothetical protein
MSAAARALFANVCKNTQTAVLRHRYGTAASAGGVVGATAGRSAARHGLCEAICTVTETDMAGLALGRI